MPDEVVEIAQGAEPAAAPAFDADKVLAAPEGHDLATLEKAFGAKGQKDAQGAAPAAAKAQDPNAVPAFDAAKEFAALSKQITALSKEVGQGRKLQSEFAKLPQTVEQLIEQRLSKAQQAQREAYLRGNLTAEEREAYRAQQEEEAKRQEAIKELVAQQVEQRLQVEREEREGVQNYATGLEQMAGQRFQELEPEIKGILGRVQAALDSQDPEEVKLGLQAYDYFSANPAALLWNADQAFRSKSGQPAAAAHAPAAAPVAHAAAPERRGAGVAPRIGGGAAAPASAPKTLKDMKPEDFTSGAIDMAQLEKLLGVSS